MSAQQHSLTSTQVEQSRYPWLRSAGELAREILLSKKERAAIRRLHTSSKPGSTTTPAVKQSAPLEDASQEPFRPVVLPQISPWPTSPIIRAYASALADHDMPTALFMRIIDAYNLATAADPGMQVLDAAGAILGLVPEPHVQIASHAIAVAVAVGEEELSRARGEILIRKINREVLEPRRLRMEVVKGKDLPSRLRFQEGEKLPVMPPLSQVEAEAEGSRDDEPTAAASTNAERRILALGE